MKEITCECGHVNPYGTIFCEACGKVLNKEEEEKKLLDMKYEGSARRSQTYNKSVVDKIWNFFSSVKVGVTLIILPLIAASIGTIFPQEMYIPNGEPAETFYESKYGWFGEVYYELGLHNLYSSWWFLLLVSLLGVSLVIASLDRFIPLFRALKNQRVIRNEGFLRRQRIFGEADIAEEKENYELIKTRLKEKRYNIREENGNILAEKNRFSRWGPYVNHIGLIIFLIGGMLRFIPGMYVNDYLRIQEGEKKAVPGTNGEYFVENHKFTVEVYDKDKEKEEFEATLDRVGTVVKNYQTDATLYQAVGDTLPGEEVKLEKVKDYPIRVNEPLKFDSFALYQTSYEENMTKMSFTLIDKATEKEHGNLTVDLNNPKDSYDLGNGYSVHLESYFPDFEFNENEQPTTKSRFPNNPAFIFKMVSPEHPEGEVSFVAIKQTLEPLGETEYKLKFKNIETGFATVLTVRKDLTLWVLALGGLIFMIGVIQGAYWNHRRIWIQKSGDKIFVAAHTNKNWFGIRREINEILVGTSIPLPYDQAEGEEIQERGGKQSGDFKQ
ncbi:cytochrome c biogenesis protein ResB [Bacillus sp. D386]|uniref:cytochrome c biogenesis protein ResB n=1 Tax=Bacillus sp. D386 TaxID=2587155 RepID=UPI0011233804|nr:cytochrome c biogenesis protein ResB [Bacillus sp. D386]